MGARGLYLRVGLLLVIGAGLLVGLVLFLSGSRFSQGQTFETYFRESVQGLTVGSPVKYRGVTLGDVTEIGLTGATYGGGATPIDPKDPLWQLVLVRFRVDKAKLGRMPDTQTAVADGLRARLSSQGLTGLAYIELDFVANPPRPPKPPWDPAFDFIPSVPSTLSQVQDAAQRLAARLESVDIEGLINGLNGLVTDLRGQLKSADLPATVQAARDLMAALRDQVQQANLPALSADLRQTSLAARDTLQGAQFRAILTNTSNATARLAEATAKLGPLVTQTQSTLKRTDAATADLSADLASILRDTQAAVGNLRDTTEALRRDPGQILFGAPPPRRERP